MEIESIVKAKFSQSHYKSGSQPGLSLPGKGTRWCRVVAPWVFIMRGDGRAPVRSPCLRVSWLFHYLGLLEPLPNSSSAQKMCQVFPPEVKLFESMTDFLKKR